MRIKQYIQMMDYALWDVIENSPSLLKTQVEEGVTTLMPITSIEDKAQRRVEVKARSTLMMGIPNEHQLKFNYIKDAKQLMEAIKKRFDGNGAIKKKWKTHAVVWRNKADLDTMSMYDLYNNLKIHLDDLEEIDLRWQMAMLTMRSRRFLKKTRRKMTVNGNDIIGFDKSNVECYNCHKRGHFDKECRTPRSQDTKHKESTKRTMLVETPASIDLVSCDSLGGYDWSDQAEEGPNYALMAYIFTSSDSKETYMPLKPDLSYIVLDEFTDKPVNENTKSSEEEIKAVRKNSDALINEEWVSDDDEEEVTQSKIEQKLVKPSIPKIEFVKPKEQGERARKTIKKGNPQIDLQDKGVIDSGCSRHMTWNMSYLTDYKEIDG
nr:hypothetical protein [Tanacetum cinerariifolium]